MDPFLGGILNDTIGWRWIFLINVPIGIVGLALAVTWLDEHRVKEAGHLDAKRLALGSLGLVALTFALSSAPEGLILRPSVLMPLLAGLLILAVSHGSS